MKNTHNLTLLEMLRIVRDSGITSTTGVMALIALRDGPMLMADLRRDVLHLTPCGCTCVVDRMEGAGLVTREHTTKDKRNRLITLTKLGQAGADRLASYVSTV